MAGTAGRKALVKVSGVALAFTNEACTHAGDSKTYQITNTSKRVWDRTAAITVKDGGVPTVESYTINRLTGTVVFTNTGTRTITVSGSYLGMSVAAEAHNYNYRITTENLDDSAFGDSWRTFVQGLKMAAGSLTEWKSADTYFYDALTAGLPVVVEFYTDSSGNFDFRMWAVLNADEISSAIAGLVTAAVSFDATTDADRRSISTP